MNKSSNQGISSYELTLEKIRRLSAHGEPYVPAPGVARQLSALHDSPGYRAVSNLLFAYVPRLLSHFIRLESYCSSGFEHQRHDFRTRLEYLLHRSEVYAHPLLRDSITQRLAGMCGFSEQDLSQELLLLSHDVPGMIVRLNSPLCQLNYAFEHALNICVRQDITPHYGEPELKKNDLAHLLLYYGCSRHFIKCIFGIHYRSRIMNVAGELPSPRRTKHDFLECLNNAFMAACILLMLSYYLMALRVRAGRNPNPKYLTLQELLSAPCDGGICLPLAVGAYYAVMVIARGSCRAALNAGQDRNFPGFEDFYEILDHAVHGRCTAVGCVKCNACHLEFSDEVICSRNLRRRRCRSCPFCSCSLYYDLDEGDGEGCPSARHTGPAAAGQPCGGRRSGAPQTAPLT